MLPHFTFHLSSTFEIFQKIGKIGTLFGGSANCEKPVFLQFLQVTATEYFRAMYFYTIQEHPVEISTKPDQRGVFSPPYNLLELIIDSEILCLALLQSRDKTFKTSKMFHQKKIIYYFRSRNFREEKNSRNFWHKLSRMTR